MLYPCHVARSTSAQRGVSLCLSNRLCASFGLSTSWAAKKVLVLTPNSAPVVGAACVWRPRARGPRSPRAASGTCCASASASGASVSRRSLQQRLRRGRQAARARRGALCSNGCAAERRARARARLARGLRSPPHALVELSRRASRRSATVRSKNHVEAAALRERRRRSRSAQVTGARGRRRPLLCSAVDKNIFGKRGKPWTGSVRHCLNRGLRAGKTRLG